MKDLPEAWRLNLHTSRRRVYTSADIVGVETGGAVKNVISIAAGISDGMAFGHNARAALITRGLAEITRLGIKLGGHMETFMGLTGAGDLILTCTGDLSRNRRVGLRFGGRRGAYQVYSRSSGTPRKGFIRQQKCCG